MSITPPESLSELARHQWPPTTPFTNRLAKLRQAVQERIDEILDNHPYAPRLRASVRISLSDLRMILYLGEPRHQASFLSPCAAR